MKRNLLAVIFVALLAVISCRSEEDSLQQIDQVLHFYIDSAGIDMLNENVSGAYTSYSFNDVYGLTDNAPVSFTEVLDEDSLYFLKYVAGARRIAVDSTDTNHKTLQSKIAMQFVTKINDSVNKIQYDTLVLNYNFTPEVFQIQEAIFNGNTIFTKISGNPNIIKIHK